MENKKEKILRFRNLVPIPISEVESFLSIRNWDIDRAVEDFKFEKIKEISDLIGEEVDLVEEIFQEYKLDYNKTVSYFKRKKEDSNFDFSRLDGLSEESFELIDEWLKWENNEGLLSAICMDKIEQFVKILRKNLRMKDLANKIEKALDLYTITLLNDFTLENSNKFKNSEVYKQLESQIKKDEIKFNEELYLVTSNFGEKRKITKT